MYLILLRGVEIRCDNYFQQFERLSERFRRIIFRKDSIHLVAKAKKSILDVPKSLHRREGSMVWPDPARSWKLSCT